MPDSTPQTASPLLRGVRALAQSPATWMVLLGFAARVVRILWLHTYQVPPEDDFVRFGWEMGRVARSIATGHGFSSVFGGDTGPTAMIPPVYPYLCGAIFRLTGVYTAQSAFWILAMNSAFGALTCLAIYRIGRLTVGKTPALLAGWFWALVPHAMKWATEWFWEMALSGLLCALMFWLALELDREPTRRRWLWFGALCGFGTLVNPAIVSLAPFAVFWLARRRLRETIRGATVAALLALVMIAPWIVRNRLALGHWMFVRDNFGYEFWIGNRPGATWFSFVDHPSVSPRERAIYAREGELAYFNERAAAGFANVRRHPGEFLVRSAYKFRSFWYGDSLRFWFWNEPLRPVHYYVTSLMGLAGLLLAFERHIRGAGLYCWIALYPLPYYVTHVQPRFRHAIEPELLLLCAFFCWRLYEYGRDRVVSRRTAAVAHAAAAAAH